MSHDVFLTGLVDVRGLLFFFFFFFFGGDTRLNRAKKA